MYERDTHAKVPTNCDEEKKKKSLHKNEKGRDLPYCVNYDILVKCCNEKKNYVDLNLEINYNLEEILAHKDNIKRCLYVNNSKNKNHQQRNKTNNDHLKNRKHYYYNDGYHSVHATDDIPPFVHDSVHDSMNVRKNESIQMGGEEEKYFYPKNNYSDVGNTSSDSSNSYCSNVSTNASKNEKTSYMNFSQRITYDNNILENEQNLFHKIISPRGISEQSKKEKENFSFDHWCANTPAASNTPDSYIRISNDEQNCERSTGYREKGDSPCYLREKSQIRFPLSTPDESTFTSLKFHKIDRSISYKKTEDEILNKYEKIIKIMKYLRRIKTKYPKIETAVSILSNHIKNVTFNCEKMFDSRQGLNDFLKKIYIYQIYLLKKVIFKNPKGKTNLDSIECSYEKMSTRKEQLGTRDHQHLRQYSAVPNGYNIVPQFMIQQLGTNKPVNIPKNAHTENINDEDYFHFKKKEKCDEWKYKKLDKVMQRVVTEKNKMKMRHSLSEEEITKDDKFNNEKRKNKYKYRDNKIYKEHEKQTLDEYMAESKKSLTHKFTNLYADDTDKTSAYYSNLKDKYKEALKNHMHSCSENVHGKKKKKKNNKKKEHIIHDDTLHSINYYQKSENFAKSNEIDILPENHILRQKPNKVPHYLGNKRSTSFDINSNEYESKKANAEEFHRNFPRYNTRNVICKGRSNLSDVLKNNYLNVVHVQKECREKHGKKCLEEYESTGDPKDESPNGLNLHTLNLASDNMSIRRNLSKDEYCRIRFVDKEKNNKKTHVLFYDINKELSAISNRDSITHALKHALLNKPQSFTVLQNFLFKIDVEMVEYKNFILLLTRNIKKPHLEALYGLNDFSIFEKVYGKKVAPRFLVSKKVKTFYKYDMFYRRFKELTNVRDFSGITDAVELI
ncbi:hypothetical protein, conserved [Plasmodium gonderi]|uniref:CKK domain-containing protein n=1 Tax=Plasmodium gonderi TaxID=77519 RepID=A0A1Y1JNF8_PLAGO|nr:hypothetical protein, conserved [Plasmodium gonderi]GAW82352.1 hypothetical protein, conserved [Plasmodium gonderi]